MWRLARALWSNSDGAVAPTVALSLIGLVAIGGVAFDYAHLAAMDTEIQQAADQAALAAATQLDGQPGAIARATAAAQSLLTNKSLLAGSGQGGSAVDVPSANIVFCKTFDDSQADTATACGTPVTTDKDAHVVWVRTGGRTANYTLTPIVGLLSSGSIAGEAVAGLSSAVCKEPPVMMCNPNSDPASFNVSGYVGKGMLLIATSGGGSYAPGNFGFLDVGAGGSDLQKLMGYGSPPDQCVDVSQPSTETGALTSVINEFNTRFDIYESGDSIGCFSGGKCPPSLNSRKDVVMNDVAPYTKNNCGIVTGGGGKGWQVSASPYRPTDSTSTYTPTPDAMGYPRDKCHAFNDTGDCQSAHGTVSPRIGTGDWDIDAYWRTNHGGGNYPTSMNATIRAVFPLSVDAARSYPTRYQVYRWEMANAATQLTQKSAGGGISYPQPVCQPPGWSPAATTPDRRTLPVGVVNCTGLNGKKPVNPIDWIDTFLVEPSMSRDNGLTGASKVNYTNVGDIYVEVIGHTGNGTGGSAAQFVRHDRPYLIR